ncbi:putative phage abortive infection protein [Lactococcus lactis]|uniref:Phage abortive infection protein n=1 Tax=Lactococcus lactis TaxID=1358 RepID=A0A9X4NAS9_9LACT|nr:putative phage abortive infection protein [Lactococcus lactis]MDG4980520.1 putative phage abortive infection protein [Lactococcus lactis]
MDILFLAQNFTSEFSDSELLSFAGDILSGLIGLLGAGLGVYGAYYVMQKQLKAENEQYRKDRIDNTFFNLLGLFQNIREELDSDNIIKSIKLKVACKIDSERNKYFDELFLSEKPNFINDIQEFNRLTTPFYKKYCEKLINELEKGKDSRYDSHVSHLLEDVEENDKEKLTQSIKRIENFTDSFKDNKPEFNYILEVPDIIEIINEVFKSSTGYSGNYFRALYRCLKYIMDSDLKMEDKKFYSGVLRGILSSDEMLVVFYNCMYFEKGEKFKELLEKEENGERIDFFGDEEDLKNLDKEYDLPFFSKEDLLFSKTDMQNLKELIKGN